MPTRQQRRAKARAPVKRRRRGQAAFIATLAAIMVVGSLAAVVFRSKPQPITRGAMPGDHWHATYTIEICGKRLAPYPSIEGEIHTHGDGRIHVHPQTPAYSLNNANLGKFFDTVESQIGQVNGKNFIRFPNGQQFKDGDRCTAKGPRENLVLIANGKRYNRDPSTYLMHDKDNLLIRFGPPATTTVPNPAGKASPEPEGNPAPAGGR